MQGRYEYIPQHEDLVTASPSSLSVGSEIQGFSAPFPEKAEFDGHQAVGARGWGMSWPEQRAMLVATAPGCTSALLPGFPSLSDQAWIRQQDG